MVSVFPVPEPIKLARQRPPKMRFTERLSTPNVAVLMRSPNISPIPTSSIRTLDFESTPLKNKNNMDGMDEPLKTPTFGTPMEKSFRCPLNDHLDLKLILTEFDLGHLEPVFESNAVSYADGGVCSDLLIKRFFIFSSRLQLQSCRR